jgi:peptidyl-prolyl cis-trans isomerase C
MNIQKRHWSFNKSPLGRASALPVVMGVLLLSACQSEPTGQVAAVVDGEEITLTEINAELANMQITEGADQKPMQQLALQRVIERKLLANSARQDGIDQTPEYIVRRQQLEDALLVQLMTQKVARTVKIPTDNDVTAFMSANPNMFENRVIFSVDQIRFLPPSRDDYLKPLGAAKTMQEVVAALNQLGIKFDRGTSAIDTAQLPFDMVQKIREVPAGEPFVVPSDGFVTVSLITGQRAAPMSKDSARPAAVAAVRNKDLGDILQKQISSQRGNANIKYQPGFAPPTKKTAGGAAEVAKSIPETAAKTPTGN